MDAKRFRKLSEHFEAACRLDEQEREELLAAIDTEDPELAAELVRLLTAHKTRHDAFDDAKLAIPPDFTVASSLRHQSVPEQIGRYRIVRIIGEGGMGTVYLAEQTEPVHRDVALKVIKPGMNSRAVIARFESERQVLAMMDHPGLSKMLDGGMTNDGLPYFVMEHVAGDAITSYCNHRQLTATDRVCLFIRVCEAVQHAHIKGVIHRDLKPSNILVEEREDGPLPRVIDFGVAKALHGPLAERTLATLDGAMLGTPAYMSPEQADDRTTVVDTRSDVYALGAVLYELLAGVGVIETAVAQDASLLELHRLICEVEPPRPSTRFGQLPAEEKSRISEQFRTEPAQHRRRLSGDLDWIVMRCLEKDPARRYDGAQALADDLRRSLKNEPVLAGPPTAGYRMRKFVARHRAGVASAMMAAAALIGAAAISIAFGLREAEQRRVVERQSEQMARVVEFQGEMLTAVNPVTMGLGIVHRLREQLDEALRQSSVESDRRIQLKDAFEESLQYMNATDVARRAIDETFLRRAAEAMEVKFGDQPLVEASLRHTLGEIYREIGSYEAAATQSDRAFALRERILGENHIETLRTQRQRALIHRILRDEIAWSEEQLLDVLARLKRSPEPNHHEIIATQYGLASLLLQMARVDEAESILREAVERARTFALADTAESVAAMADLGLVQIHRGQMAEGELILQEARSRSDRVLGANHPTSLRILNDYAQVLFRMGQSEDAHEYLQLAYEKRRLVLGVDHPHTLVSLMNLGQSHRRLGHMAEAEACYRESIAGHTRFFGPLHTSTINVKQNLAVFFQHARRFDEAEELLRKVINARTQLYGPEHAATLVSFDSYCGLLNHRGQLDECEACLADVVERCLNSLGPQHEITVRAMYNFAAVLFTRDKFVDAEPLLAAALQGQITLFGAKHDATLGTERMLALVFFELGRYAEAEAMMLESLPRHLSRFGSNDERSRALAGRIEELYRRWHEVDPDGGHEVKLARWREAPVALGD